MTSFDVVWRRIVAFAGETFHQRKGKAFTYAIAGGCVVPGITNRRLSRSQFARAYERAPLRGPGQLQDLQGPSFLFAILTDPRVAAADESAIPDTDVAPGSDAGDARAGNDEPDTRAEDTTSVRTAVRGPSVPSRTLTSPGRLFPAGILQDIEPRRALLVVTCSRGKAHGGMPPSGTDGETLWPPQALSAARARVLATAAADLSKLLPAAQRYTGTFYQQTGTALADAAAPGHLVIISGGYGIVRSDELIGWYDKQLRLADWPAGLLESVLIGEARRAGTQTVVAFAATTSQYARLLRRVRWRDAGISAHLVTVTGVRGGAQREVPRRLGQAFSAFWCRQQDSYPPGTVVENLS
jgi:hypothetical protein